MTRRLIGSAVSMAVALGFSLMMCAPASGALVGYWPLDGNASDASGSGNNGTLNGGASFSANVPAAIAGGTSLSVDGDGDFVNVPADGSLNGGLFTLTYWANQDGAVQNGNFERLTSRGGDTFETAVSGDGSVSRFDGAWVNTGHDLPGTGWQHIAWVGDGANLTLFVNGVQQHQTASGVNPSGLMNIGARHSGIEGFQGLIDDVALFNKPLPQAQVQQLADGTPANLLNGPVTNTLVVSNTGDWQLSTESVDGGGLGTWTAGALTLPAIGTYTLTPTTPAVAGINNAVNGFIGMGAQPLAADNNVHFYRTEFFLSEFTALTAELTLAVDNGAAVFINGVEIAREESFVVDNWQFPLPALTINPDGTISDVVKFDSNLATFGGFVPGLNEIVVAVRNPNSENNPAGGFGFKLLVSTDAVPAIPEPATASLLLLAGAAVLRRRRAC